MADDTPFYFEAIGGDIKVSLVSVGTELPAVSLEKSYTGSGEWASFPVDGTSVTVTEGQRIYLRSGYSGNSGFSIDSENYRYFQIEDASFDDNPNTDVSSTKCGSGGNVMSLLGRSFPDMSSVSSAYCFYGLFRSCDMLVSAPLLPAISLSDSCYGYMFSGCSSLRSAPSLSHVSTLGDSCCEYMFSDCTEMSGEASFPAAELKDRCYAGMFSNSAITSVSGLSVSGEMKYGCFDSTFMDCHKLDMSWLQSGFGFGGVTVLAGSCFARMFSGTGISSVPQMPQPTVALAESCYEGMFEFCSDLYDATNFSLHGDMEYACCRGMFQGCNILLRSGLNDDLFSSVSALAEECFMGMFSECTALVSVPSLPGAGVSNFALAGGCYSYMFSGCISLTSISGTVPSIMENACFCGMFSGCTRLTYSGISGFSIANVGHLAESCFMEMFSGCSGLSRIPGMPSGVSMAPHCFERMFSGCEGMTTIAGFRVSGDMAESCCAYMFERCSRLYMFSSDMFASVGDCAYECFIGMFSGCTSLVSMPNVSATNMAESCCAYMFEGCSSIDPGQDSWISSESLAPKCFYKMFSGCSGLVNAPSVPDAAMAEESCSYMFAGCKKLMNVPDLASTSLALGCYSFMFSGCTSIVSSPAIAATELAESSCRCMFNACTSLVSVGDVAAFGHSGVMGYGCCYGMFYNCKALVNAPSIEATSLGEYCFGYMFAGCTSLIETPSVSASSLEKYCCAYMFNECSGLTSVNNVVSLSDANASMAQYCCTYMFCKCTGLEEVPELNAINLSQAKGCYLGMFSGCTGIKGLPKDVLKAEQLGESCYESMFSGCTGLGSDQDIEGLAQDALPATSLAASCYSKMFNGCINLKESAILPATTLPDYCYESMFSGCNSLVTMREVTALTTENAVLSQHCCDGMFRECRSLSLDNAQISASTLKPYCLQYMFKGCENLGYVEVVSTTMSEGCCKGMFSGCTGMTDASFPLPSTLAASCFEGMYSGCSELMSVYQLDDASAALATNCYKEMFLGCRNLQLLNIADLDIRLNSTSLAPGCYESMFSGCGSLSASLELPATTLAASCYKNMFSGCSGINIIRTIAALNNSNGVLAESCCSGMFSWCVGISCTPRFRTAILAKSCYERMFSGCTGITKAQQLPNATLAESCYEGMFEGCSQITGFVSELGAWSMSWTQNYGDPPEGYKYAVAKEPRRYYSSPYDYYSLLLVHEDADTSWTEWDYDSVIRKYEVVSGAYVAAGSSTVAFEDDSLICEVTSSYKFNLGNIDSTSWEFNPKPPHGHMYAVANGVPDNHGYIACKLIDVDYSNGSASVVATGTGTTNSNVVRFGGSSVTATAFDQLWYKGYFTFDKEPSPGNVFVVANGKTTRYYEMTYVDMALVEVPMSSQDAPALRAKSQVRVDGMYGDDKTVKFQLNYKVYAIKASDTELDTMELAATTLQKICYRSMFKGCESIVDIPSLPAQNISGADSCYESMFENCTGLKSVPANRLMATTIGKECCKCMFKGCTGLGKESGVDGIAFSALPATSLAEGCYRDMFYGCDGILDIPELPATDISGAPYCYSGMFCECSKIRGIPANRIKATRVGDHCCENMFRMCTGLGGTSGISGIDLNALPATSLGKYCYQNMFEGCNSLDAIPRLPAVNTSQADGCYSNMFNGCVGINDIPENIINAKAIGTSSCARMFYGCSGIKSVDSLSFESVGADGCSGMFNFCTGIERVSPISARYVGARGFQQMFEYCTSLSTFLGISVDVMGEDSCLEMFKGCTGLSSVGTIKVVSTGERSLKYMFADCGNKTGDGNERSYYGLSTAPIVLIGSMSVQCLYGMFRGCANLEDASAVDISNVEEMKELCCCEMFSGCEKLNKPPKMTSKFKMAKGCFSRMFEGCGYEYDYIRPDSYPYHKNVGLVSAPEFSVKEMDDQCCEKMFINCVSLKDASKVDVSAEKMAESCCSEMFSGCVSLLDSDAEDGTGDNILPTLSTGVLAPSCYEMMFLGCKSLKRIPSMSYSVLDNSCFRSMFEECTGLLDATGLDLESVDVLADYCCCDMFLGCNSLVNIPKFPSAALANSCFKGMFSGCESISAAPNLPSKQLAESCYEEMFAGCIALHDIPMLPATELSGAPLCYAGMFMGCSNEGFTSAAYILPRKLEAVSTITSLSQRCFSYMFAECTSLTTPPVLPSSFLDPNTKKRKQVDLESGCYEYMFDGCTSLSSAPELPAEELASKCYMSMFSGCTSLTLSDFVLPAEELADGCYKYMFYNCSGLVRTSTKISIRLYAKKMARECCYEMFAGCTNTNFNYVRDLFLYDIDSLSESCFEMMFHRCENIINTPKLPSGAELSESCYAQMFYGCSKLTDISQVNLSSIKSAGYESCREMFAECESLAYAPEIECSSPSASAFYQMFYRCSSIGPEGKPPKVRISGNIGESCCYQMFLECTSLFSAQDIKIGKFAGSGATIEGMLGDSCCYQMFLGCSSLKYAMSVNADIMGSRCFYQAYSMCMNLSDLGSLSADYMGDMCCFEMFKGLGTETRTKSYSQPAYVNVHIHGFSTNASEIESGKVYYLNPGRAPEYNILWFREKSEIMRTFFLLVSPDDNFDLSICDYTVKDVYGNETSVLPKDGRSHALYFEEKEEGIFIVSECESNPLYEYSGIVDTPYVRVSNCGDNCFERMFYECYNLRDASRIDLSSVSDMPKECCKEMFKYCDNLSVPPNLPSNARLGNGCFHSVFHSCASKIDITGSNQVNITYGLAYAPAISATVLGESCCENMFYDCFNLSDAGGVDFSGVTEMDGNCCRLMFRGCSMLGFDCGSSDPESCIPKLTCSVIPLPEGCYDAMFYECINIAKAPDIISPSAEIGALSQMFYGCSNLEEIKVAFMSDPDGAFESWMYGVKKHGKIYVPNGSSISAMIPYKGEPGEWEKVEY